MEGFIQQFVGSHNLIVRNKDLSNLINNVLFVFENLNWVTLQLLLKTININISGGSVTKRHLLSTANFNLALFLINLGYSAKDIYSSFDLSNENSKFVDDKLELSKSAMLIIIDKFLINFKASLLKSIENLEKEIFIKQGNVLSLETDIASRKNKKLKSKKIESKSKQILNLTHRLDHLKNFINKNENEILNLKSKISETDVFKSKLSNKNYEELKEIYYNKFHNNKVYDNLLNLRSVINFNRKDSFNSNRRSFSTFYTSGLYSR